MTAWVECRPDHHRPSPVLGEDHAAEELRRRGWRQAANPSQHREGTG
jgi:hypothetical protein